MGETLFIYGTVGAGKTTKLLNKVISEPESAKIVVMYNKSLEQENAKRLEEMGAFVTTKIKFFEKYRDSNSYECPVLVKTLNGIALWYYNNYRREVKANEKNIEYLIEKAWYSACKDFGLKYDPIYSFYEGTQLRQIFDMLRYTHKEFKPDIASEITKINESLINNLTERYYYYLKKYEVYADFIDHLIAMYEDKVKVTDFADVVYVDEANDLTPLEIAVLYPHNKKLVLAGDLEQTIYWFKGVNPVKILELYEESKKEYLTTIRRLPRKVFMLAMKVRDDMVIKSKEITPVLDENKFKETSKVKITKSLEEAIYLARRLGYKDIMILAYTNYQVNKIITKTLIEKFKIIPDFIGEMRNRYIKFLLEITYKYMLNEDVDLVSASQCYKVYKYLNFKNPKEAIISDFERMFDISVLSINWKEITITNEIKVGTVFCSKGLEADCVIYYDYMPVRLQENMRYVIPNNINGKYLHPILEGCLKLLYVAITRTKKKLIIVTPKKDKSLILRYGYNIRLGSSVFE